MQGKRATGWHLGKKLDGAGQGWGASNQDCPLCLLHQGPDELGPLGTVRLQGMAFITDHHPKAAEKEEPSSIPCCCMQMLRSLYNLRCDQLYLKRVLT